MMDRSSVGDAHTTTDSPVYGPFHKSTVTALLVGAILMLTTIAGMLLVADSELAEWGQLLYSVPILGILVFGALLTAGRYLGLSGIGKDNFGLAFVGAALSIFAYAWFGGLVLTPYEPSLYVPALAITGVITTAITLVAGAYVHSTDKNLEHWARYSAGLFLVGIVVAIPGTIFLPLLLITFVCFLLGFFCDLIYEIWMTSNRNRSPVANGLAMYIAFAGVFVHILQLILRILAKKNS